MIPIVPGFDGIGVIREICVAQDFVYVRLRKAKVFVQMGRRDGIRNKVVCPGEDALLGNAETAGDDGKTQGSIVLQGRTQHATNDLQHLRIVAVGTGLSNGNIVLVDEQDHRFAIMGLHHLHQERERGFQHSICRFSINQIGQFLKDFTVIRIDLITEG